MCGPTTNYFAPTTNYFAEYLAKELLPAITEFPPASRLDQEDLEKNNRLSRQWLIDTKPTWNEKESDFTKRTQEPAFEPPAFIDPLSVSKFGHKMDFLRDKALSYPSQVPIPKSPFIKPLATK
jgi:hypothetical protein